jgi:PAS domain S-box-containing protein
MTSPPARPSFFVDGSKAGPAGYRQRIRGGSRRLFSTFDLRSTVPPDPPTEPSSSESASPEPASPEPALSSYDVADDPAAERQRLAAVQRYDDLDGVDGEAYEHVADLAASVLEAPCAFVTFVHEDTQRVEACVGREMEHVALSNTYCVHTIQSPGVLVVEDARSDDRFAHLPIVHGTEERPGLPFYAGAPIETPGGHRIGTLCVLDTEPRERPDDRTLRHLERLAQLVVDELELRRETAQRKQHEQNLRQASQQAEVARAVAERARSDAESALQDAEAATRSRSRFLAGIAHDIRSPLSIINGLAERLSQSLDGTEAGHARKIHQAAQQLSAMAQSLSDLARLDQEGRQQTAERIDLRRVVREAVQPLEARADRAGVELHTVLPDAPVRASLPPTAVRRVTDNLVGNALKYCEAGDEVVVRVNTRSLSGRSPESPRPDTNDGSGDIPQPNGASRHDAVGRIVVADTGPGIDPDFVPRLFEPFSRDAVETDGTGLGLAVTHELVSMMDGRIAVDSEVGEGTTMTVTVPLAGSGTPPAEAERDRAQKEEREEPDAEDRPAPHPTGAANGAPNGAPRARPETPTGERRPQTGERRLRSLVQRLPGAIYRCTYDEDWVSLYMGDAFREICGIDPDTLDPVGRSFKEVVVEEDLDRIRTQVGRAVDERTYYSIEYRIEADDGTIRWVEDNGRPVFNDDGSVQWLDGILLDVTSRKEAEEALRRMNETLEKKVRERTRQVRRLSAELAMAEQRERDQIARVLHDDLQQFLYAVQVKATMLVNGVEDHPQVCADDLPVDPARVAGLLTQAIETTRGLTVDLAPPVLESDGLLEALQWLRSHMREQHDFTVHLHGEEIDRDIPNELRMVLFQAVRELVRNVHDHAETDAARVDVEEGGDGLVLHVVDRGIGFDSRDALATDTSGFGLENVKERLRFFGATLEIASTANDGTRCTICLPERALTDLEDVDPFEPDGWGEPV